MTDDVSLHDRKVIYRARRGLKEIDMFFDPYVRDGYLHADPAEKAAFARLVAAEDPDLLDWFMNVSQPDDAELLALVQHLKQRRYSV
ncbi:MAG: succinate dehydrogenase assembly factor 2 [Pseudomonadota bacterium]|nr:succinate dehydrogenase assembly factor 2 [Pseudomonadota bacterium]